MKKGFSTSMILFIVGLLAFGGVMTWAVQAQAADYKKMTIRIAHVAPPTDPRHLGAMEMKKLLEGESKGNFKVDVYPAGQLGGGKDLIESAQGGALEIIVLPAAFLGGFQPLVTLLDIPYLFPVSQAAAVKVINGPAGDELLNTLLKAKLVGLDLWDSAYKHFSANKPLRSLDDFKGLKFRVMPSPMLITMIKAFGGSAVSFPYQEVYTGLQTGAIDGQEASLTSIYNMKFHEVQKFVTMTYHIKSEFIAMAGKTWFDGLNRDTQTLVRKAARAGAAVNDAAKQEEENKSRGLIQKAGTQIIELKPTEIQNFKKATFGPCRDVFVKKNGDAGKKLLELFETEITKVK